MKVRVQSIRSLLNVVAGDRMSLWYAFHWEDTPQGERHWLDRYWGVKPLSDDDRGYLIRMANAYEERRRWRS